MQKKVLSLIFVLCLLLGLFPLAMGTAAADSSAEYTEIGTAEALIGLMGDSSKWTGNYRLTANITLTADDGAQASIGNDEVPFTGIFDGNGKSISGIDITVDGHKGVGLFGIVRDAEIRDLTVSGQVTATGANFSGGLIGAITGNATVENCVNNITLNAVSRIGGVVGGVVLNNALATAEGTELDAAATATVVIRNCVNNAAVTGSSERVGGVVGAVSISKVATRNVTVENCVNNGTVVGDKYTAGVVGYADANIGSAWLLIDGCTNNASVTGVSQVGGIFGMSSFTATTSLTISNCVNGKDAVVKGTAASATCVGGIVGRFNLVSAGTASATVTRCKNLGTVEAPAQLGGIVGYTYYKGTTISECFNAGSVTGTATTTQASGGADAGGILGLANPAVVENCINTGAIEGTSNKNVGGIVGRTASTNTIRYNYNAGTTTSGTNTNCAAILGGKAGTVTITNNYYSAGSTDANATAIAEADIADSSKYAGFDATVWVFTTTGPELAAFHEHTDANGDNKCDTCGTNLACTHPTTETRTITPATCAETGVGETYCTVCNEILDDAVTLAIDPNNHAGSYVWTENADGTYNFVCKACSGTVFTQSETPVVYLDAGTVKSPETGTDTNDGLTAETAVYSISEAVKRLATTGGKIYVADRYTISANITLPAYEKEITFTTENRDTGFAISKHGVVLSLGGPTKFENIIFNGASTTQNASDKGYYNTPVIVGNWNDVTFGEKLTTYGNAYFVAGKHNPTADDDEVKDVKLVFTRTTANKISDSQAAVTFFNRIYLGSRVTGSTHSTVSNKTVTADFVGGTTAYNIWAGTTSSTAADVQMVNCHTVINAYEKAYIQYIRTGDSNGNTSDAGTAYMDSLTVNLYDNARVYKAFAPKNVRNMTLNISGTADGRDYAEYPIGIQFGEIGLTSGYLASENYTGSETLTMNYTTHSFAAGIASPSYSSEYAVTENVTDECVWDDGVVTTAPGVGTVGEKTYTCSVCGATKTEEVEALKAALTQKSITAVTDTASGESTIRFIAKLELADGVTVEKYGTYIALVALGEDGTPSAEGAKVVVKEQTVTDAAPATFALDLTGIPADQTGTNVYAWSFAELSDGTRVSFAFDAASVTAVLAAQQ